MMRLLPSFALLLLLMCSCGEAPAPPAPAKADPTAAPDTMRDGQHVFRDAQGRKRTEGGFVGGRRHGLWNTYNSLGRLQSRNEYVDGLLEGPTITFRENGAVLYQGQHRHGLKVGEWRFYDEAGEVARTVEFDEQGREMGPR